jgi:hypothetical protein
LTITGTLSIVGHMLCIVFNRVFSARIARQLGKGALVLAACVAGWSAPISAQGGAQTATVPDLSGGWLLLDSEGSGSFDGRAQRFPPAALTAAAQAMAVRGDGRNVTPNGGNTAPHQAGEAYVVNNGACTPEGTGGSAIDPNSTAFFLLQSKDEVLLVREGPGGRRIHMDGRGHPAKLPPSMYGHSIGRYEGGALMVDTVGLPEGAVQGGGRRRPETRLTERFQLAPDGKHLTITYTWDDPTLYVRPHTYEHSFERLPADSYAFETWCDSSDPLQRQSIVPPKQQ